MFLDCSQDIVGVIVGCCTSVIVIVLAAHCEIVLVRVRVIVRDNVLGVRIAVACVC